MHFKHFINRWQGMILTLIAIISTLYLAYEQKLNLYIHPRYIQFTTILSIIGLGYSFAVIRRHPKNSEKSKSNHNRITGLVVLCVTSMCSLLIFKPTTLTNSTASQRGINSSITSNVVTSNAIPLFGGANYSNFTVRDWSSLLFQSNDINFFKNKSAKVTGFISPDTQDPYNVFYVSRFVISCCAVDARAIGVPVYYPDWQRQYKADDWVEVKGTFYLNPSSSSQQKIAIKPSSIQSVSVPKDPYVY